MKFLIIGLGSMGKRRIRCLKALGHTEIAGFDRRTDRCEEANTKYGVSVYSDFDTALRSMNPDVLIISVPPDMHHIYMKKAIELDKHFFVEASVVDTNYEWIKQHNQNRNKIGVPSATMLFHPAVKLTGKILQENRLGKISNVLFQSGQYLPDWHTYEKVSDFYVSNPLTGGAREIVPFELTWIVKFLGFPKKVVGNLRKTIDIEGAEKIDDTYNFLFDYQNYLASITIDVVSRHATRRLLINGEQGQLVWDWDQNCIEIYNAHSRQWEKVNYEMAAAEKGYNTSIGENMYIEEIKDFIDAANKKIKFVNDLENDHRILKILYAVEESQKSGKFIEL